MPKPSIISAHAPVLIAESPPRELHLFTEGLFPLTIPGLRAGGTALAIRCWARLWFWSFLLWIPFAVSAGFQEGPMLRNFIIDLPNHVRFLIAIPLLVYAGILSDVRIAKAIRHFPVRSESREEVESILATVERWRDSLWLNMPLLLLALGLQVSRVRQEMLDPGWEFHTLWALYVGKFVLQVIALLWMSRTAIWTYVLWRYSRVNLRILLAHPDKKGGLAFLNWTQGSFGLGTTALSAILVANLYATTFNVGGMLNPASGKVLGVFLLTNLLVFLGPLLFFTPQLSIAKNHRRMDYNRFANQVVEAYERKWVPESQASKRFGDEALTEDISFVCDLRDTDAQAQEMSVVVPGLPAIRKFLIACLLPVVPVLVVEIPGHLWVELAKKLFL